MFRLISLSAITVVLLSLLSGEVLAQRDAGAKMRGDFGRGFSSRSYGGPSPRSMGMTYRQPAFTPAPAMMSETAIARQPLIADEEVRRFSIEPIGIQTGDRLIARGADARIMRGLIVVGAVPTGLEFQATAVVNGWLGVNLQVDGQTLNGWVWHENVTPAPADGA